MIHCAGIPSFCFIFFGAANVLGVVIIDSIEVKCWGPAAAEFPLGITFLCLEGVIDGTSYKDRV